MAAQPDQSGSLSAEEQVMLDLLLKKAGTDGKLGSLSAALGGYLKGSMPVSVVQKVPEAPPPKSGQSSAKGSQSAAGNDGRMSGLENGKRYKAFSEGGYAWVESEETPGAMTDASKRGVEALAHDISIEDNQTDSEIEVIPAYDIEYGKVDKSVGLPVKVDSYEAWGQTIIKTDKYKGSHLTYHQLVLRAINKRDGEDFKYCKWVYNRYYKQYNGQPRSQCPDLAGSLQAVRFPELITGPETFKREMAGAPSKSR